MAPEKHQISCQSAVEKQLSVINSRIRLRTADRSLRIGISSVHRRFRNRRSLRAEAAAYFTRTFFRRKVGISRSWPSTMVGSLFSKRPRVTGSNCSTSCFACSFFSSTGLGSLNGAGFFLGQDHARLRRRFFDDRFLRDILQASAAPASISTAGSSAWINSSAKTGSLLGSRPAALRVVPRSAELEAPRARLRLRDAARALTSSPAVAGAGATSSSVASELINVTLNRFPIRPSTDVPKRICV